MSFLTHHDYGIDFGLIGSIGNICRIRGPKRAPFLFGFLWYLESMRMYWKHHLRYFKEADMGLFDKRIVSLSKSIAKLEAELSSLAQKREAVVSPAARLAVDAMASVARSRKSRLQEELSALQAEEARQTSIPGTAAEPQAPGSIPGRKR